MGNAVQKRNSFPGLKLNGFTAVVTGGSRGIGFEVVRILNSRGANVIVGSRDPAATFQKFSESAVSNPNHTLDLRNISVLELDLASIKSTNRFCNEALKLKEPNAIINTAYHIPQDFIVTEDSFEKSLQVNYLSPTLLINSMLPKMSPYLNRLPRIINLSHHVKFDFKTTVLDNSLLNPLPWGEKEAYLGYISSKQHLVIFSCDLAAHYRGRVVILSVNPGGMTNNTSNNNNNNNNNRVLSKDSVRVQFSSYSKQFFNFHDPAKNVVSFAVDPQYEHCTGYFFDSYCNPIDPLYSKEMGRKLKMITESLLVPHLK